MQNTCAEITSNLRPENPVCPVFGDCGGCVYQDIAYEDELKIKERELRDFLRQKLEIGDESIETIIPSPEAYYYRHRLDIGLYKKKDGHMSFGFMQEGKHKVVVIESCALARREVCDFLPELKQQAVQKFPSDYRTANLVVKTGADGRVFWGGIGRKSLQMEKDNYLWTEIHGKKIFYSLDTFFQANLAILPRVVERIKAFGRLDGETLFFDLYSGVGLFGVCLADEVKKVVMIEECPSSIKLAKFNIAFHGLDAKTDIYPGKVEEILPALDTAPYGRSVFLVDPPRRGLKKEVLNMLNHCAKNHDPAHGVKKVDSLFYLSCSLASLGHDLSELTKGGWRVIKVMPFDFFPRTKHLETLVLLRPENAWD